jgi:glycosyltransferase involved in cell wall biosynthesis
VTSVSVCFPAYNEEETIRGVLEEAHELLAGSGIDYEILVCDDGSIDATGRIIDEVAGRVPRMRVIHHPQNLGIHLTFEHLYHEAGKEFVFLNSTDGQWETRVLFDLLPLTREYDVVLAIRQRKHYGFLRAVVSWGFNMVPRLLFGLRTSDAGAVKLVKREIIQRFPLVSRSPFSEAERLIRASRAGYRITQRPTATVVRQSGRARGLNPALVVRSLRDVPRVWLALRHERAKGRGAERTKGREAEVKNADR